MSNSNEVNWDENTWKEINDAVVAEVLKVRTAQKVFPTTVFGKRVARPPRIF